MTQLLIVSAVIAIVSAGCCSHPVSSTSPRPQSQSPASLRIMSFNIRNSGSADGINAWPNRREHYLQTIRDFAPDIVGTQEVLADQYEALASLSDMRILGVARDDGARKGEWSALLFRASRFELLASGTFWLSETPDVSGSKSWDAALPRICTWARLRDRVGGREVLCANTHFDHRGKLARANSARLLAGRLPQLAAGAPVILIGDFNSTDNSEAHGVLTNADSGAAFADSYRSIHPQVSADEATFHAFTGRTAGSRIDWILHTPQLRTEGAQILRTPAINGVYPSDHYPVTAIMEWR